MWSTILVAAVVLSVFVAVLVRGIQNKRRHRGGCAGCGCAHCPGKDMCRPK